MKTALRIFYAVTAIVVIFNTVFLIKDGIYFDINKLPAGTLAGSTVSPDGSKTLNVYEIDNSVGCAVRGEIVENGKAKNVYWQTDIEGVSFYFSDDNAVTIGSVSLDLKKGDVYDCRRGVSLFQEGSPIAELFADK